MKIKTVKFNMWPYALTMTAVFAAFKLGGVIDWSWWLVFSPVIAVAIILVLMCIFLITIICLEMHYRVKNAKDESERSIILKAKLEAMQKAADELQQKRVQEQ